MTDSTYTTLSLSWTKPKDIEGEEDEAKGYFVEIRPAENTDWDRCNANAITMNSYTVKGMKSMAMYWVRVIATNDGGEGKPQELDNYILAMPPPGKKLPSNYSTNVKQQYLILHNLKKLIRFKILNKINAKMHWNSGGYNCFTPIALFDLFILSPVMKDKSIKQLSLSTEHLNYH